MYKDKNKDSSWYSWFSLWSSKLYLKFSNKIHNKFAPVFYNPWIRSQCRPWLSALNIKLFLVARAATNDKSALCKFVGTIIQPLLVTCCLILCLKLLQWIVLLRMSNHNSECEAVRLLWLQLAHGESHSSKSHCMVIFHSHNGFSTWPSQAIGYQCKHSLQPR